MIYWLIGYSLSVVFGRWAQRRLIIKLGLGATWIDMFFAIFPGLNILWAFCALVMTLPKELPKKFFNL
jgi:hypothetical protein